jgi:hypothetical protein
MRTPLLGSPDLLQRYGSLGRVSIEAAMSLLGVIFDQNRHAAGIGNVGFCYDGVEKGLVIFGEP